MIKVNIPEEAAGAVAWGDITGTLSDQTDLNQALSDIATVNVTSPISGDGTPLSPLDISINALTQKNVLADNDLILIEDSADSYNPKKALKSALAGSGGGTSETTKYMTTDQLITLTTEEDINGLNNIILAADKKYLITLNMIYIDSFQPHSISMALPLGSTCVTSGVYSDFNTASGYLYKSGALIYGTGASSISFNFTRTYTGGGIPYSQSWITILLNTGGNALTTKITGKVSTGGNLAKLAKGSFLKITERI